MVTITKRPYDINWSGNPILYAFYSEEARNNADIYFEIRLLFKNMAAADFSVVATIPLTPYQGLAAIDVSELLRSQLTFGMPSLVGSNTEVKTQSGFFYVEYREYTVNGVQQGWNISENQTLRFVVKGGISPFLWKGNNFWVNYYPDNRPFLSWAKNDKLVSINERLFLSWLNLVDVAADKIEARIKCYYTDGSYVDKTVAVGSLKYSVNYVSIGAPTLQLAVANKTIWYWEAAIYDITNAAAPVRLSQVFRFVSDNRNDYNQVTLYYRTSLGGLDSVRIRGVIETSIVLEGSEAETAYVLEDGTLSLPRIDVGLAHRETAVYKGDTGHLEKQEQERLRDAFLNREVWMEKYGRWWPVKLTTKQYRLRTTQDKLFSLPIEWTLADGGSFYYTPDIDLGAGALITNVCSATVQNIQHTLAYFAGGTACSANYTFEVYSPDGENIQKIQYRIPGLIEEWTDFAVPYAVPLQTNHAVPSSFTIYMRAVCAEGSTGQVNAHQVNIPVEGSAPVGSYNSNLFNDGDFSTPYTLTVNGFQVGSGNLPAHAYGSFNVNDAASATVVLITDFVNPDSGVLTSNGVSKNGVYSSNKITWTGVNIVNGLQIHFT